MDVSKTSLERAFELAASGKYLTLVELRAALSKEGYTAAQTNGPTLGRQLREIMRQSRGEAAPSPSKG